MCSTRLLFRYSLLVFLVTLCFSVVTAEVEASEKAISSLFFSSTGYGYYKDQAGVAKAKEMARTRAESFGLEKCKKYLIELGLAESGYSLIPDARGSIIRVLADSEVDAKNTGANLIGIRITGEVQFTIADGKGIGPQGPLQVVFSSNKNRYAKGDEIRFSMQGNKDFYGSIVEQSSAGETVQLLPIKLKPPTFFKGGTQHAFPDKDRGEGFHLLVDAPYGKETVRFFASTTEFDPVLGAGDYTGIVGAVNEDMAWVRKRFQEKLTEKLGKFDPVVTFQCRQFYETEIEFTTAAQ